MEFYLNIYSLARFSVGKGLPWSEPWATFDRDLNSVISPLRPLGDVLAWDRRVIAYPTGDAT